MIHRRARQNAMAFRVERGRHAPETYGCLAVTDGDSPAGVGPACVAGDGQRSPSPLSPRRGSRRSHGHRPRAGGLELAPRSQSGYGRPELWPDHRADAALGGEVQMPVHKAVSMAISNRERAVALYDWDQRARRAHGLAAAAAGGDLLFRRGDYLEVNPDVFAMDDGDGRNRSFLAGWCRGTSGIFPREFVELLGEDEFLDELDSVSMRDALLRDITREKFVAHMLHEHYERRHNMLALPVLLLAALCSFFSFLSTGDNGFSRWFIGWSPVLVGWMAAAAAVMQGLQHALGYNFKSECFANAARAYALIETQLDHLHRTLLLEHSVVSCSHSAVAADSVLLMEAGLGSEEAGDVREKMRRALELVEEEILDLRKTMRYLPPSDIVDHLHKKLHEAADIPGFGAVFTATTDLEAAMGGGWKGGRDTAGAAAAQWFPGVVSSRGSAEFEGEPDDPGSRTVGRLERHRQAVATQQGGYSHSSYGREPSQTRRPPGRLGASRSGGQRVSLSSRMRGGSEARGSDGSDGHHDHHDFHEMVSAATLRKLMVRVVRDKENMQLAAHYYRSRQHLLSLPMLMLLALSSIISLGVGTSVSTDDASVSVAPVSAAAASTAVATTPSLEAHGAGSQHIAILVVGSLTLGAAILGLMEHACKWGQKVVAFDQAALRYDMLLSKLEVYVDCGATREEEANLRASAGDVAKTMIYAVPDSITWRGSQQMQHRYQYQYDDGSDTSAAEQQQHRRTAKRRSSSISDARDEELGQQQQGQGGRSRRAVSPELVAASVTQPEPEPEPEVVSFIQVQEGLRVAQEQIKQVASALEKSQHHQPSAQTGRSAAEGEGEGDVPSPLTLRLQNLSTSMQEDLGEQEGLMSANMSRLRELEQAATAEASSGGGMDVISSLSPVGAATAAGYKGRTPSLDQLQSIKMSV